MVDIRFSAMVGRLKRSEIRELLKLTRKPEIISFAGGLPDPRAFPLKEVREAADSAIDNYGDLALQYSPTEGDPMLKEQLAAFMKWQGEDVKSEDIFVVSSSQQGLDLLAKVFIDSGDPVLVENPTYIGTLQAFRSANACFHGLDMDYDGVIPELLEKEIKSLAGMGKKPKFVYLIPDFQNPSGITLSLERRKTILEIASRYDLLIVEDSPYRELRYMGDTLPSLFSMDTEGRVVHMKTFSKIFCPGFRIGWIVGPAQVIDKMVIAKQSADLCTSAFVSITSANFIKAGHLQAQIETCRKIYARKGRIMLDALDKYMPKLEGISWSKPEGGMFLWVKLPEYMDTVEMFPDAVDMNVAYVIGSAFHFDGSGRNTMRLNYSFPTEEQIDEGVKRLAKLIENTAKLKNH